VVVAIALSSLWLGMAELRAEPRRTTEQVTLRKKPGEKETALVLLEANTEVTVLAEEGRWLKVKVRDAVGYLTRTTVTTGDAPTAQGSASDAWSAARRTPDGHEVTELFVDAPSAGVLAASPEPSAAKVADVPKGTRLTVLDAATPGWLHARDAAGHEGWIASGNVQNGAIAVEVPGVDLQGRAADYNRAPEGALAIRGSIGFGYRSLGMDLSSNAEGGLTNYLVDADAAAAVLALDVRSRLVAPWFVAGDARVELSSSSPGIDYPGPTAPPGKIPFTTFATDAGARAGLRLKSAIDLALRVGGHYDAFVTKSVDNAGMLPRERLLGVTAGLRADILPPHSRFAASARFDILALGSRAQTPGLEDGTSSTAHALWGGVTVRYQLARHVAPFAGYDFGRATTSWTGMSVREPGVTDAHRVDTTQLFQLGIAAEL
jgi:hypothetical protein